MTEKQEKKQEKGRIFKYSEAEHKKAKRDRERLRKLRELNKQQTYILSQVE